MRKARARESCFSGIEIILECRRQNLNCNSHSVLLLILHDYVIDTSTSDGRQQHLAIRQNSKKISLQYVNGGDEDRLVLWQGSQEYQCCHNAIPTWRNRGQEMFGLSKALKIVHW